MKKQTFDKNYKNIFEQSPYGIFIMDVHGRFVLVNHYLCELLGYKENELLQMKLNEIYAVSSLDQILIPDETTRTERMTVIQRAIKCKDNNIFYANITLINIGNNFAQGILVSTAVDKNILSKLVEFEQRFRQITENIRDVFFIIDVQTKHFIFISPAYEAISGEPIDKLYAEPTAWFANIHAEDVERIKKLYQQSLNTGRFDAKYRIVHRNNSIRWMHTRAFPVYNEQNQLYRSTGVAEDITEHMEIIQERLDNAEKIIKNVNAMLVAFSTALEQRDPYTAGHQNNVAHLSVAIAQEMGLAEEQINGLEFAANVHDIGKIGIPSSILNKSRKLNKFEYGLVKTHAKVGYDILKDIQFPWPVAAIVLQHHERLDGSGYPNGLKDKDIRIETKILSVADVVDAMASHRPYRPSLGIEAALNELEKGRGTLYDKNVVEACKKLFMNHQISMYSS